MEDGGWKGKVLRGGRPRGRAGVRAGMCGGDLTI